MNDDTPNTGHDDLDITCDGYVGPWNLEGYVAPQPPEGFNPNDDPDGSVHDFIGPTVDVPPGYSIDVRWDEVRGIMIWVEQTGSGDPITPDQAVHLAEVLGDVARKYGAKCR